METENLDTSKPGSYSLDINSFFNKIYVNPNHYLTSLCSITFQKKGQSLQISGLWFCPHIFSNDERDIRSDLRKDRGKNLGEERGKDRGRDRQRIILYCRGCDTNTIILQDGILIKKLWHKAYSATLMKNQQLGWREVDAESKEILVNFR